MSPRILIHIFSTAPPSNSWIIGIIWLYLALNRTPNIDCYWERAVPDPYTNYAGFCIDQVTWGQPDTAIEKVVDQRCFATPKKWSQQLQKKKDQEVRLRSNSGMLPDQRRNSVAVMTNSFTRSCCKISVAVFRHCGGYDRWA